jgi:hypothetical protein
MIRSLIVRTTAVAALATAAFGPASAQQPIGPERIVVPLSNPGAPALVEVALVNGGITVEAYDGREVIVEARARADGRVPGGARGPSARRQEGTGDTSGMMRIPNDSAGLSVEESNNHVEITSESWRHPIDIKVRVPASAELKLGCVNSGDIAVTGVHGEMELSNVNGSIEVDGAAGAIVADTVNGKLRVVFARLDASGPMAFNAFNSNVDLTFPASLKADVSMRSDNGEIFSDFEIALSREPAKVEQERREGKFRVVVEKGVRGTIGGGGREIRITTFNGNILLRRAK